MLWHAIRPFYRNKKKETSQDEKTEKVLKVRVSLLPFLYSVNEPRLLQLDTPPHTYIHINTPFLLFYDIIMVFLLWALLLLLWHHYTMYVLFVRLCVCVSEANAYLDDQDFDVKPITFLFCEILFYSRVLRRKYHFLL